jgi:dienelactone hydrolase
MKKIILLGIFILFLVLAFPIHAIESMSVPSPDQRGPFHIGKYKVSYKVGPYGRYIATIRYPATRNGWFAPVDSSEAPYPGIVVANGYGGSDWNIKWIPKHLTSHGYVTLCFTPPHKLFPRTTQWAEGFHGGIAKLKMHSNSSSSPIYNIVDIETFGAIGLSMGGGGCIEATGANNSEIDAAVPLAPAPSFSAKDASVHINVPIQIQIGNEDGMVPPYSVLPFYTDLIPNATVKEYLSIAGGNHIGFIDEFFARIAENIGLDNPCGIAFKEQRRISRKYFTSWFQYHLKNLTDYYTYIFGEEAQNDIDTGVLADLRYNIP